jgi:hypothetical protein
MELMKEFLGLTKTTFEVNNVGKFILEIKDQVWYIQKDLSIIYPEVSFYIDSFDKSRLLDKQIEIIQDTFKSTKKLISLLDNAPLKIYNTILNYIKNKVEKEKFIKDIPFKVFNQYVDILCIGLSSVKSGDFLTFWFTGIDERVMISIPCKNWILDYNKSFTCGMDIYPLKIDKFLRGVNNGVKLIKYFSFEHDKNKEV